jgi:shikimate dehydrogenase
MDALKITGTTKILGVMGDPIEHSLSPVMHNAAIQHLGLDFVYVPLAVKPADLPAVLAGLQAIGCGGFNATIPHKQAIMAHLAEISPVAKAIGAVNTVWRVPSGWAGTNTDILGFLAPLQALPKPRKAVILGYGGAARAIVAGCLELGCTEVWVVGRDADKLAQFQASWPGVNLQIQEWPQLAALLPAVDLVVNCSPVGMYPQGDNCPLTLTEIDLLPSEAIVYDLIYTPRPTKLLQLAADRGCQTIDGLEMLVHQGAAGFEIWTGAKAPIEVMRQALLDHLQL